MLLPGMPWNIVMFMHQVLDAVTSNEANAGEKRKTTKRLTQTRARA